MLVVLSSVTTQYFIAYNGITTPIDYWLQRAERVDEYRLKIAAKLSLAKITILYCYFKTILLLSPLFLCYFIQKQPYFNSMIIFHQKKEPYFIIVLFYFIPIFIDNRNKFAYFKQE
jgi:hypothetical protein